MIDLATLKTHLHAICVNGSGLDASKVYFANPTVPAARPAPPALAIRVRLAGSLGRPAVTISDAPAPAPGAEILHSISGLARLIVELTYFGLPGQTAIAETLLQLKSSLAKPSQRNRLDASGICLFSGESLTEVDGIENAVFAPRAIMTIRGLIKSSDSELGTYIETSEITINH